MKAPDYAFLRKAGRILNSRQARTLVLTGNIYDLFCQPGETGKAGEAGEAGEDYVPLLPFLARQWDLKDLILVVYEVNGPIRFVKESDQEKLRNAWVQWRAGMDANAIAIKRMLAKGREAESLDAADRVFEDTFRGAVSNPTLALELLRQLCLCSRTEIQGKRLIEENLLILVEGADLLLPDAPITSLSDVDRQRVHICHDWFSDPGFVNGGDAVVLLAESRSLLHHRVARLPQLLEVEVSSPDDAARQHFISWFIRSGGESGRVQLWGTQTELAKLTAGLSIHALMQLMKGARHEQRKLEAEEVILKVEAYIQSQLGEDIVEFKKPGHSFKDIVGFSRLKAFLQNEMLPRLETSGLGAISGAAVCGPIGGGKTFIFEALASELDMVVLVIKNIRSQWFGQTDVLFERLRRVLNALAKVLIFVDEADTQLGGVGSDTHETERRLTGKFQAMMSDPALRGRVVWLLVTARIHQLSPDLRRPGRVGDLIIPVLDPEGEDREAFIQWTVKPALARALAGDELGRLGDATRNYSAAGFASLRSELKAKAQPKTKDGESGMTFEEVLAVVTDHVPPAIEETRRYQTLQALVNCTRRSLLPDPGVSDETRRGWAEELRRLEARGIR